MKTILTVGVYDLLHIGHVKLLERAKALGDRLIVAVQKDEFVNLYKPQTQLFYNLTDRIFMVSSLKFVDQVIPYATIDLLVQSIDFDILVVGPDQTNEKFIKALKWCNINNKEVVTLPRTDGISSSILRKGI